MPVVLLQQEFKEPSQLSEFKRARLEKQQYRLVGNHSAVKICFWCKKSIRGEAECYKNDFYGIPSHQCLEMSPAITCNKRCKHCWRDTSVFSTGWVGPVDTPQFIVESCIRERAKLLNGFPGNQQIEQEKVQGAFQPTHAAISLTGEPMMYPRFPELVKEFFRHGFTTVFVVTSGTVPETIRRLDVLPTNLYLSVEAWDKEMYSRLCIPVISDAWELFLESAELMRSVKTRTIMKITCMKGLNMHAPESFAFLVERMAPDLIACKAYAWMGYSKERLSRDNTPNFEDVDAFARKLGEIVGYEVSLSKKGSDIVLLRRTTPRIVEGESFMYEGLEKEKARQQEYVKHIASKI